MHTIIGGRSAIDMTHLRLGQRGREGAYRFLQRYGYDLENPAHADDVERIRVEGLGFLRGVMLPGLPDDVRVPADFDELPILDLIRLAAGDVDGHPTAFDSGPWQDSQPLPPKELDLRRAWACALLRVMHTIAHAVNYFQGNFYREIRERILDRFVAQVRTRDDGSQYLHCQSYDVPLVRFEVKETKPLRSVVLKLLQKQENVAYDLFDHIGVRIIVVRPVDALFAIRALREEHAIMYPNIKPTRSRNTLVDLEAYDRHVRACLLRFQRGELDDHQTMATIMAFDAKPAGTEQTEWNPYSSDKYRSIQFTCRQMIRFPNPLWTRLTAAQAVAHMHLHGEPLRDMLEALSLQHVEPEIQFFFPYEVQVMDIASFEAATLGRASYADYKVRQIQSVRRRILPRVLELSGHGELLRDDPPPMSSHRGGAHQPIPLKKRAFVKTGMLPSAVRSGTDDP
jgi:uncharacterized protein (TIGR04562 family)